MMRPTGIPRGPPRSAGQGGGLRLRLDVFDPALVREVSEAALRGAMRRHGLTGNTVVLSGDAGQVRIPDHALCWVRAERLLQKLMPKVL